MPERTCSNCQRVLSLESFKVDNRRPDRRCTICKECNRVRAREYWRKIGSERKRSRDDRPCQRCGTVVSVRRDKPTKYCRTCSSKVASEARTRAARPPSSPVAFPDCEWCGRAFTVHGPGMRQRRTCGVCSSMRVFVEGPCGWCGDRFTIIYQTTAKYCSQRCKQAATRKRHGKFSLPPQERQAIYERDGWICQLCMEPVDPDLDHANPWSATLDHIVCRSWQTNPDHSASNLRLAHRWCNSVRGDEQHYTAEVLTV